MFHSSCKQAILRLAAPVLADPSNFIEVVPYLQAGGKYKRKGEKDPDDGIPWYHIMPRKERKKKKRRRGKTRTEKDTKKESRNGIAEFGTRRQLMTGTHSDRLGRPGRLSGSGAARPCHTQSDQTGLPHVGARNKVMRAKAKARKSRIGKQGQAL